MPDILHFAGEHRAFDPEHIYGTDLFGGCYRAADAEYDATTDRTALHLVPIPRGVIQERGIIKALEAQAERDITERIEHLLFVGGVASIDITRGHGMQ